MKNSYHIIVLLAVSLSLGTASIQAMKEKKNVGRIKKQFNKSLARFGHCMQGDCTRGEALRMARDLGISAAVLLGVIYGIKKGFGGRSKPEKSHEDYYNEAVLEVKEIHEALKRKVAAEDLARAARRAEEGGVEEGSDVL